MGIGTQTGLTRRYVTVAGIDSGQAPKSIEHMHGTFRIPTLVRNADQLVRGLPRTVDSA